MINYDVEGTEEKTEDAEDARDIVTKVAERLYRQDGGVAYVAKDSRFP